MAELTALERAARRKTKANTRVRTLMEELAEAHREYKNASVEFYKAKSRAEKAEAEVQ